MPDGVVNTSKIEIGSGSIEYVRLYLSSLCTKAHKDTCIWYFQHSKGEVIPVHFWNLWAALFTPISTHHSFNSKFTFSVFFHPIDRILSSLFDINSVTKGGIWTKRVLYITETDMQDPWRTCVFKSRIQALSVEKGSWLNQSFQGIFCQETFYVPLSWVHDLEMMLSI